MKIIFISSKFLQKKYLSFGDGIGQLTDENLIYSVGRWG